MEDDDNWFPYFNPACLHADIFSVIIIFGKGREEFWQTTHDTDGSANCDRRNDIDQLQLTYQYLYYFINRDRINNNLLLLNN